jgi:Putative glucoamylase
MYGVYFVGYPPSQHESQYYHNGALYSDPRISAYIGMGLRQMPGNVWWRTWRILPPKAPYVNQNSVSCSAQNPPTPPPQYDPDFSWTGQSWGTGSWQDYIDPQSGQTFHVWEGHYTYPDDSSLTFVPTWAGGMFEGEMANQIVPETSWGTHSFGLNDLRWAQVQMKYAKDKLGYPVWGMSPSSTPDDTGNYQAYGATGLAWPYSAKLGLSQSYECCGPDMESAITPHASFIALDVLPQDAYANIQALRANYPSIYGPYGFFDAVAPNAYTYTQYPNGVATTYGVSAGQVGHRYLVLDQSMIMAAIDNALNNREMQRHFAADPVSWAAQTYLSMETMSIH